MGPGARRGDAPARGALNKALLDQEGLNHLLQRVARFGQDLAGWDYETVRMDVFAETARRFVTVLAAQERLALADELLRLARAALKTVELRVREGASSPVERTRAEVTVSAAQVDRDQAEADLEAARIELAALWAAQSPGFAFAEGDLYEASSPPSVESLLRVADQNPDLARWTTELALRDAAVDLEDARRIPNFSVGIGPRYASGLGDSALVAGVSIPLPVFDRNQGQALATRYERARALHERHAAETRVRSAILVVHKRLAAAYMRVTTIASESLPGAEAAYTQTLEAYQRGLFRYLDALDAQRTLFAIRASYIEALESYHRAVADLERLTGEPLRVTAQP